MSYSAGTDEWEGVEIVGWGAMRSLRVERAARLYGGPAPTPDELMSRLLEWVNGGNPVGRLPSALRTETWVCGGEMIPHSREEIEYCMGAASGLPEDAVLVAIVPGDSRKQFILLRGIVWERMPSSRYYEVSLK